MKNYKHMNKGNNAMKLAAVASAAVMLAPVAMSSVSSFAAGTTPNGVNYPVYSVVSVNSAYNAGSSLQVVAPYLFANNSAIADALKTIDAINTNNTVNDPYSATKYADAAGVAGTAGNKAAAAARAAYGNLKDINSQLSKSQQADFASSLSAVSTKLGDLTKLVGNSKTEGTLRTNAQQNGLKDAALNADSKVTNYQKTLAQAKDYKDANGVTVTAKEQIASALAKADAAVTAYNKAAAAYKAGAAKYTEYTTAVTALANQMVLKTNNGSVARAALLAKAAIEGMPAGSKRDATTKLYNSVQGDYLNATEAHVSDGDGVNAAKIDAAAKTAVNALLKIADDSADSQAAQQLGVVTVNYNPNYGIQIWNKAGQIVRFDDADAKAYNAIHPGANVKPGDAKKLPGQSSWQAFNNTYKAHGTTYYNLGGDQYIDASYVTPNF